MLVLADLEGGPHDGLTVERSGKEAYLWITANGRPRGVPTEGATVYRLRELRRRPSAVPTWRYVFIGHGVAQCEVCGWFGPVDPCVVCGARVEGRGLTE